MRERLGLAPEDRFAVMAANSARHLELWHAALFGAGIINPLNLRFSRRELVHVLRDSGAKVVFTDALFATSIAAVREEAGIETVVLIADGEKTAGRGARRPDVRGRRRARSPTPGWDEPEESDACVLMYTGGTTGLPKGVLLEQRAMTLTCLSRRMHLPYDDDEVYLLQTPMFHAASFGGIAIVPAFGGTTALRPLLRPGARHRCHRALRRHQQRDGADHDRHGDGPPGLHPGDVRHVAPADLRRLADAGRAARAHDPEFPQLEISQAYGMTESAALLTGLGPEDHVPGRRACTRPGRRCRASP